MSLVAQTNCVAIGLGAEGIMASQRGEDRRSEVPTVVWGGEGMITTSHCAARGKLQRLSRQCINNPNRMWKLCT